MASGRSEPTLPTADRPKSGLCQQGGLEEESAEITVPFAPGSQASGVGVGGGSERCLVSPVHLTDRIGLPTKSC